MICKRCGYCCIMSDVIVKIQSDKSNIIVGAYKPVNQRCWNLEYQDDVAVCKIHELKIYKNTPCYTHHNDKCKDECRMGVFLLGSAVNLNYLEDIKNYPIAVPNPVEIQLNIKESL